MEKEKVVIVAERVKSVAIGFIGICFVSLGTSYFEEQLTYRVPRILLPVFNLFGNVGLAIGLIMLGGALLVYSYLKWKKYNGNKKIYFIVALLVLILAIVLALTVAVFKDSDERISTEQRQENLLNAIKNADKPTSKNAALEKHLAEFDVLYTEYQEKVQANDDAAIQDCEQKYIDWTIKVKPIMDQLSNDEKVQLATYLAKLSHEWSDTRQSLNE
jgi:uncharacterized membrane protein